MPKPRSKIDKENSNKKKANGWVRIGIWIHPDHKPEARRKEHEEWRTPIDPGENSSQDGERVA